MPNASKNQEMVFEATNGMSESERSSFYSAMIGALSTCVDNKTFKLIIETAKACTRRPVKK